VALDELVKALAARSPMIVEGTAVFLTQDASVAPSALLHNLKHNKALHRTNIMLTVEMQSTPYVQPENRRALSVWTNASCGPSCAMAIWTKSTYPAIWRGKGAAHRHGHVLLRRAQRDPVRQPPLPRIMVLLYQFLHRNASDPTAFFAIPPTEWSNWAHRSSFDRYRLPPCGAF
jgi:KUP system potassium uptake protein